MLAGGHGGLHAGLQLNLQPAPVLDSQLEEGHGVGVLDTFTFHAPKHKHTQTHTP